MAYAPDTYGQIWRLVKSHVPLAPPLLAQSWVTQAYRDLVDKRPWSWLRTESEFVMGAAKVGNVNTTQNSNVVVDAGIGFAASDAGRQLRIAQPTTSPVYTITTVNPGVSCTIDRVYGPSSAAGASATVLDAYITCPADFGRFTAVLDQRNNWTLHIWVTDEELNTWDAQRSASGTPWAIATRRLSTYTPTSGQVQYELWPYQQASYNYPFFYIRRAEVLNDSTTFLGPLATRGDILTTGALAYASEWPGPDMDHRNPYFNLNLAKSKREQFEELTARLEVIDEDIAPTWYETISWLNRLPWAPIDAKFLQGHDVPWGTSWGWGGDFGVPWTH